MATSAEGDISDTCVAEGDISDTCVAEGDTSDTFVAEGDISDTSVAEGDTSADVTQENENNSEQAPLPTERFKLQRTSLVWSYFTQGDDKLKSSCNECRRIISTKGGNTTNMKKHLRISHRKLFAELIGKQNENSKDEEPKRSKSNRIMVKAIKLYVGNLPDNTKSDELQATFEKYGKVEECDVLRNYAFIHISNEDEANVAMESLNNSDFNGSRITVEISHNKGQCFRCGRQGHIPKECPLNAKTYSRSNSSISKATKLYVGNLTESITSADLRTLFEKYGKVEECDVLKNYGFVHMTKEKEARAAVDALHQSEFMDTKINVEISKSKGQCYSCGQHGHWSKECMSNTGGRSGFGGSSNVMSRFGRQGLDRGFGIDRSYRTERMRPYPDLYDRRPLGLTRPSSDDFYRGYSDYYNFPSRSTSSFMSSAGNSFDRDYDYGQYRRTQDTNSSSNYNYMWSSSNSNTA